jgi:HEAT repeat protein
MSDLAAQLQDPDFKQRVRALLTLRSASPEEVAPLAEITIRDTHVQMRSYTCMLLGKKPSETAYQLLVHTLQSDLDQGVRADAAGALGAIRDTRGWEYLIRAYYEDTEWIVRYSALVALGNLADARTYDVFVAELRSDNELMQQAAVGALGELHAADAVPLILPFVAHADWMMRQKAAIALSQIRTEKSLEALRYLAKDSSSPVAITAQAGLDAALP